MTVPVSKNSPPLPRGLKRSTTQVESPGVMAVSLSNSMVVQLFACCHLTGKFGGVDSLVGGVVVGRAVEGGEVERQRALVGVVGQRGLPAARLEKVESLTVK